MSKARMEPEVALHAHDSVFLTGSDVSVENPSTGDAERIDVRRVSGGQF